DGTAFFDKEGFDGGGVSIGTDFADVPGAIPSIPVGGQACFRFFDLNGNVMPAGTNIEIELTETDTIPNEISSVPNSVAHRNDPMGFFCLTVLGDAPAPPLTPGLIEIKVTSPGGIISSTFFSTDD
ncbi:MAG: hypothetical protein MJA83_07255, partial [Gammaproteobacteria bacterium]|nr:hypothetical protein [Gammaproteobacteria bacterium]